MPILSVDVPQEIYTSALRMLADLIETGSVASPELAVEGDPELEDHDSSVWSFDQHIPAEHADDVNVLLSLYLRLSETAQHAVDLLALAGHEGLHQDALADLLGVGGASGLAGLIGHITKSAQALGKDSPIWRDATTKTYRVKRGIENVLRNVANHAATPRAALQGDSVEIFWGYEDDDIYTHVFPYDGQWWSFTRGRPVRYLDVSGTSLEDGAIKPREYSTREVAEDDNHELFEDHHFFFEFFPDHERKILVGHTPSNTSAAVWQHDIGSIYHWARWSYEFEEGDPRRPKMEACDRHRLGFESHEWLPLADDFNAVKISDPGVS
jgi:hypothetical protein